MLNPPMLMTESFLARKFEQGLPYANFVALGQPEDHHHQWHQRHGQLALDTQQQTLVTDFTRPSGSSSSSAALYQTTSGPSFESFMPSPRFVARTLSTSARAHLVPARNPIRLESAGGSDETSGGCRCKGAKKDDLVSPVTAGRQACRSGRAPLHRKGNV